MEEVEQKIILAEVEMEAEHHLAGSKLGLRYTSAVSMVAYVSLPPVMFCRFMVSIQRAVVFGLWSRIPLNNRVASLPTLHQGLI